MHVKIYTTPTCGYCQLAKQFFQSNHIEYEEVDVSSDQNKAEEMVRKSGQMGVPVIVVTKNDGQEEVLVGFQEKKLKELIN